MSLSGYRPDFGPGIQRATMANLIITYWRDIPSAVSVKIGRKEEKRMLADRFQEAIDMAAMRGGIGRRRLNALRWQRLRRWRGREKMQKCQQGLHARDYPKNDE